MRLTLLLLLVLPAAAADPRDPSHDRDGDGVVTDQEERLHRRDERRARRSERRAQRGEPGDDGGSTTEEDDARQAAAEGKASRLADAMKALLPSADAGAMPAGLPGGSGAAARSASPGAPATGAVAPPPPAPGTTPSSGDPANPVTAADLLLAARGPYSPALEKAGLKLSADGRGFVRLSDGKPATPEDLERLRAGVMSMPAALARRPDFHSHVSPGHFAALQKGYREGRPASVYKDVGATEKERDFVHTRSCEKMSGDCNRHAQKKAAYKKGEYVAPEDLERMYAGLRDELASSEEEEAPGAGSGPATRPAEPVAVSEEEAPVAGAAPARTPEAKRAAAEAEAYSHTPSFLGEPVRRVIARGTAWLSPTAASSPYLMWRVWLALGALLALAALTLRRRD